MRPVRLVLDTNVLLSALLFPSGALTWLRHAWHEEAVRPLVSRETALELVRVLGYPKFRLTGEEREDLLGDFLPWSETVTVPEGIEIPHCRDPLDHPFLELAIAARADYPVTGDKDLLALAGEFAVPILTPAALRERLRSADALRPRERSS